MNLKKKILVTIAFLLMIIFFQVNISKATTVTVATETLNLRREASTDSDIILQLSEGDECELIEEEGTWYKVRYGDYTGYIGKDYTKVDSDDTDEEATNETSSETTSSETSDTSENDEAANTTTEDEEATDEDTTTSSLQEGEGIINENTSLRIAPLINSSVLENVKSGAEVTVISQAGGWSYIYTDEASGWIRSDAVTVEDDETTSEAAATTDETSDNQQESTAEEETTDDTTTDNAEEATEESSDSDYEEKTMYTNDIVNIRAEASTDSDIIMVVDVNTELTVIGEEGDWYKVETSQGDAYVSKDLLSDEETTITTTSRGSSTNEINEAETKVSTSNYVIGEKVVEYAKQFLGVPYVYGGASSNGFDCSGFTMYVFDNFEVSLPHGAKSQSNLGTKVIANKESRNSLLSNLEVGDLVFFLDYESMSEIGHCGIYIGDGDFIHASSGDGYCVKIDSLLPGNYYNTRYYTATRVI